MYQGYLGVSGVYITCSRAVFLGISFCQWPQWSNFKGFQLHPKALLLVVVKLENVHMKGLLSQPLTLSMQTYGWLDHDLGQGRSVKVKCQCKG
jgi:hypothetical protein